MQLGKDDGDFSVSLWLDAALGTSQILSMGVSQYGGSPGFVLFTVEDQGQLRLQLRTANERGWKDVQSEPFAPDTWTLVTLTYVGQGEGSVGSITVNGRTRSGPVGAGLYNDALRIGDQGYGSIVPFAIADMRSYPRALAPRELRAQALAAAEVIGLSEATLLDALARLRAHVDGDATLDGPGLTAAVDDVVDHAMFLPARDTSIRDALDLLDRYESTAGALFVSEATKDGFARDPVDGESDAVREAREFHRVFQAVHDEVFRGESVAACREALTGRRWATADYFPGVVTAALDPDRTFTVALDASVPPMWGRPVIFADQAKLRPTGLYLPPGSIGRVRVPPALVDAGFAIQVGAHTADHSNKGHLQRLERVTRSYPIEHEITPIASPLGGGIYVEVPYAAQAGTIEIDVQGAVEAPFFSMRSADASTLDDWQSRRTAGAPWADFVSDHFMMQVPRDWVYAKDDPTAFLGAWDTSLQAFSEFVGIPSEHRNDVVLYVQPDIQIRASVFGIGYPQVDNLYDPRGDEHGDSQHPLVTDPFLTDADFHELGHAQLMSMFRGETEAIVNFPVVYPMNTRFGIDLATAFSRAETGHVDGFTPDEAAQDWMVTENFRNGAEMDDSNTTKDEFRYQFRGFAKYVDIVRLYDWEVLTGFNYQEHVDYEARTPGDGLDPVDSRILRLSIAAGEDLTPLIHFWGIHPVDPETLRARISEEGLPPATRVRDQLLRYRDLIPADNAAFLALFEQLSPGMPAGESPDYGSGWYHVWAAVYDASHAERSRATIDAILALYFP